MVKRCLASMIYLKLFCKDIDSKGWISISHKYPHSTWNKYALFLFPYPKLKYLYKEGS